MARHRAALVDDIERGGLLRVDVAGRELCLARTGDDGVFAVDDTCPHEFASLSEGELEGCEVECPLHYSRFDIRTGAVRGLPATEPATVYDVEVEGGVVYVSLPAGGR